MIRWSRPATSDLESARRERFARWMDIYWSAAHAWWVQYEAETALYKAEAALYKAEHPRPTLRAHMIGTRGQPR